MIISKIQDGIAFLRRLRNDNYSLSDLSYVPRWIIFYIDLGITFFAGLLNYYLLDELDIEYYNVLSVEYRLLIYVVFNGISFLILRTYSGLIRHSSFIDAIKIFIAVGLSHSAIIVFDFIQWWFTGDKIFVTTVVIINFVYCFIFLLLFRIAVKMFFEKSYLSVGKGVKLRTIVYGTDANAIAIANALQQESPGRFKIIGFVDQENKASKKRIFDIRIYKFERPLPILIRFLKIQAVILIDPKLEKEAKIKIIESCLENEVKVYTAPLVNDLESDQLGKDQVRSLNIEELLQRDAILLDNSNVSNSVVNKVIMVTGGAGSIGSEIVMQLSRYQPKEIIIVDQAETPMHDLELLLNSKFPSITYHFVIGDIRDAIEMEGVFATHLPDFLYHAAAYKHVPMMEKNPSQAVLVNILGTKIIANLALKYNVSKFVFISTDKAVNPTNIMGATKRISELYTQSLFFERSKQSDCTKFITTRFGNVLGSNGSVVQLFSKQIEAGGPLTLTHPEVTRYFMTIPEACQLVLEAGTMGEGGEIFLFDMGESIKIVDLAIKMIQLSGLKPHIDIKIKFVGLRPGEKLYEELLSDASVTMPTHHHKILIAKEERHQYDEIQQKVAELVRSVKELDTKVTLELIKDLVPEYQTPEFYNKQS